MRRVFDSVSSDFQGVKLQKAEKFESSIHLGGYYLLKAVSFGQIFYFCIKIQVIKSL